MEKIKKRGEIKGKFIFLVGAFVCLVAIFVLLRFGERKENSPTKNEDKKCGIESCHGLEITCGEKVPEVCTLEYRIGDFCRNYVSCEKINGKCVLVKGEKFDLCKACVEECEKKWQEETEKLFECENLCREKIKN